MPLCNLGPYESTHGGVGQRGIARLRDLEPTRWSRLTENDPNMTKQKHFVDGICVYSGIKQQLLIVINDPEHEVVEEWTLPTKICTKQGDNKPIFIATNFDLI